MEKMCRKMLNDVVMTTMKVSRLPLKSICNLKLFLGKKWKLTTLTCDEFIRVKCVPFLEETVPYFKKVDIIEN